MGKIIANINQINSAATDLEKAAAIISDQKAILDQIADTVANGWKSTETSRFIQCTERSKKSMTIIDTAVKATAVAMRAFAFQMAEADARNDTIVDSANMMKETVMNVVSQKKG